MSREPSGPDDLADAALARRLADAAGRPPDADVALFAVRARVVAARRRRMRLALAAFVLGVAGIGGAAALRSHRSSPVVQSDRPPTGPSIPVSADVAPATTTAEQTTAPPTTAPTSSSPPDIATTDSTPPPTSEPEVVPSDTVAPADPPADPSADPSSGETPAETSSGGTPNVPHEPSWPSASSPPDPSARPSAQTIISEGGSIRVDVVDHRLVLSEVQPADGRHVSKREVDADRVVVEFASDRHVSSIEVDLVAGRADVDVDERQRGDGRDRDGGGHGTGGPSSPASWPTTTTVDDGSGPGWDHDQGGGGDGGRGDGGDYGRGDPPARPR